MQRAHVLIEVLDELNRAVDNFPPMVSAHEGFAILKEEVDELWDEVKKNPRARDNAALSKEAVQVAAMALRFIIDVCAAPETKPMRSDAVGERLRTGVSLACFICGRSGDHEHC